MIKLDELLEQNAHRPPIVYYEKRADPWTAGLLFQTQRLFKNSPVETRLLMSDRISFLFIKPNDWGQFDVIFDHIREERDFGETEMEYELFVNHLAECSMSWETLLLHHQTKRAILVTSRTVDTSWLDEEVLASQNELPTWFYS